MATDFDFIAKMSKMAFFVEAFFTPVAFWNMISMIFVVLHDILHYCKETYRHK